jgi:hypothetical protein
MFATTASTIESPGRARSADQAVRKRTTSASAEIGPLAAVHGAAKMAATRINRNKKVIERRFLIKCLGILSSAILNAAGRAGTCFQSAGSENSSLHYNTFGLRFQIQDRLFSN